AMAEPSAHQRELAHRYILATQPEGMLKANLNASMAAMGDSGFGSPEEQKETMQDMLVALEQSLSRLYPKLEPIIADTFSESELQSIVDFYESPAGRALIEREPQMTAKLAPEMKNFGREILGAVLEQQCSRRPSNTLCSKAPRVPSAAPQTK
ncbi:MAG TPA: DUF2059 domain-containing protein, partial [Phenylobacterium sp.]|nr:DUF2059 domain-containing protein [Phenylobacterium sp.]